MTPAASRTGLSIAAVVLVLAVVAGLSPLSDGIARGLEDKPVARSLDRPLRSALLEEGFRLHTDPQGRFSVGIPPGYELDIAAAGSWRFSGPVLRGLTTYILIDIGQGARDLAELDAARDRMYEEESNLPYTKIASDTGELDGRPGLNRALMLGAYRGWDVVSLEGTTWVSLTLLCHEEHFFEHEPEFRKVIASFRLSKSPSSGP